MKYMRIAIMLFVLAAVGAALASGMSDSAVKTMLDKAGKFYDAKQYAKAVELYDQLGDYIKSDTNNGELYDIACNYSLAGRKERAIEILKLAFAAGWSNAGHMTRDTDLDNIREEPAFKQIMAAMIGESNKKADSLEARLQTWHNPGTKKKLGGRDFEQVGAALERLNPGAREIRAFTPFKERIYLGYGHPFAAESGAIVTSFNPVDGTWRADFRIEDAIRRRYRQIGDYLYEVGCVFDENQHASYRNLPKFINIYRFPGDGSFIRYHTARDASVAWDIAGLNGQLFILITEVLGDTLGMRQAILRSADGGETWQSSHEFVKQSDLQVSCRTLTSFRDRLYAFPNLLHQRGAGKFVVNPFDGNEALVYDGSAWTGADLIADKDLISVGGTTVFKDQLVMLGLYFKPGDDSTTLLNALGVLYAWNGEGKASRIFQTKGFDLQGWFAGDDAFVS